MRMKDSSRVVNKSPVSHPQIDQDPSVMAICQGPPDALLMHKNGTMKIWIGEDGRAYAEVTGFHSEASRKVLNATFDELMTDVLVTTWAEEYIDITDPGHVFIRDRHFRPRG